MQAPQAPATRPTPPLPPVGAPSQALGCPPGRPPAPRKTAVRVSSPGNPHRETPSPSPSPGRAPRAGPRRAWRGLRGSGLRPRGAPTHPGRLARTVTSGPSARPGATQVRSASSPRRVPLHPPPGSALPGPGLSPRARDRLCRRRGLRSPRRPATRWPAQHVPEVPGVGGAGAERRRPRSPDSNENSDSNLAQSAAIGRGGAAAHQWERARPGPGRG